MNKLGIWAPQKVLFLKEYWLMCASWHLNRSLNVEIGVEYWMNFVVVFLTVPYLRNSFWGTFSPSWFRKGRMISLQKLQSDSFFFWHCRKQKHKQIFNLQRQIQYLTSNLSKWHDSHIRQLQNWFVGHMVDLTRLWHRNSIMTLYFGWKWDMEFLE